MIGDQCDPVRLDCTPSVLSTIELGSGYDWTRLRRFPLEDSGVPLSPAPPPLLRTLSAGPNVPDPSNPYMFPVRRSTRSRLPSEEHPLGI